MGALLGGHAGVGDFLSAEDGAGERVTDFADYAEGAVAWDA